MTVISVHVIAAVLWLIAFFFALVAGYCMGTDEPPAKGLFAAFMTTVTGLSAFTLQVIA
jgi:hypothetical protein